MLTLESSYYVAKREINKCNMKELDLSEIKFFTPTMLLLLLDFRRKHNLETFVTSNTLDYVKRVLEIIPCNNTTSPFKILPKERDTVNGDVSLIMELLDRQYGGMQTLFHLLDEMITNIYEHSQFENAYTLSQIYPRLGVTEISFYDDGISIPKSYENAGYNFNNDCEAIEYSINGPSTLKESGRGLGINTSIQLVTEGNRGQILIISRNGLYYINHHEVRYKPLDKQYNIKGTLVSIRVKPNQVQDFYQYMEKKTIRRKRRY